MDVREKLVELIGSTEYGNGSLVGKNFQKGFIEKIASHLIAHGVTVQEFAGWEEIEDDWSMETIYKCSACKEEFVTIDGTPPDNLWNYCPHCGAKIMHKYPKGD